MQRINDFGVLGHRRDFESLPLPQGAGTIIEEGAKNYNLALRENQRKSMSFG